MAKHTYPAVMKKRLIPEYDVMPYDEHYIELAEREYASGSSPSWEDIEWK